MGRSFFVGLASERVRERVERNGATDTPPFQLRQGAPTELVDLDDLIIVTQIATS